MKFAELLEIVGDAPVFEASLLLAGDVDPVDVASQLSRWVSSGRLVRLRRGLYLLGAPYAKRRPEPFEVANMLVAPSYVSGESALSFHGHIPESVFTVSSVTTRRQGSFSTSLGEFQYQHVSPTMFWGYTRVTFSSGASAFVAFPEKALLDLVYLRAGADSPAFLRELRLERLDRLDTGRLLEMARRAAKPKLERAARFVAVLAAEQAEEYEER